MREPPSVDNIKGDKTVDANKSEQNEESQPKRLNIADMILQKARESLNRPSDKTIEKSGFKAKTDSKPTKVNVEPPKKAKP